MTGSSDHAREVREVSHAEAVRLCAADPWLRFAVTAGRSFDGWHYPLADLLVVARHRPRARTLDLVVLATGTATGSRHRLAAVRPLLEYPDARSATFSRELAGQAPAALGLPAGSGIAWDWMWTSRPPAPRPGETVVEELDDADQQIAGQLRDLLKHHSPRHSAEPGTAGVAGWVGVRHGNEIVACAAWFEPVPGVPLLASVAVRSDIRRAGLGAALTAAVTRRALAAGAPAVTVDLYADNEPARRLYHRLGFHPGRKFVSWGLPRA